MTPPRAPETEATPTEVAPPAPSVAEAPPMPPAPAPPVDVAPPPPPAPDPEVAAAPPTARERLTRWLKGEVQEFRDGVTREVGNFRSGYEKVRGFFKR
jgi:hypothetical protein